MPTLPNGQVVASRFIGRQAQLAAVDRRLVQNTQHNCQVVLVAGEAGIGKTRLLGEAHRRASELDWHIEQGGCYESDRVFPYALEIDLLRNCLLRLPSGEVESLLGPLAAELVKLVPELALAIPDLSPTSQLEPEAEKRRLFECLSHFVRLLPSPLLLIVEDLHWCDDTSLEFITYLARRLTNYPLLLLLTYRSDESHDTLQQFLAALRREQRPTELMLSPFTSQEVNEQLRSIFDLERPVRKEFLDMLLSLTTGNPFFIEEVLKSLIAGGDLSYVDGVWDCKPIDQLRIPRSVQDAVQRRSAKLSEPTRRTLTLAAVAGRRFDFQVLEAVTDHTEADLLAQIREMVEAQLVVEESGDRFAFRHALTRQAVYNDLLVRERRVYHQRIGEALETLYADDSANLAYHFSKALDWDKTLRYAYRAGQQAQALYTPRAAIEQFTKALKAADHLEPCERLPDLYRARGAAHETVGEFDLARADLESALDYASVADDRAGQWYTLVDLGRLWASRDYDKAGRYYRRALAMARTLNEYNMVAQSLNWLGNWHLNVDETTKALEYHREALDLFRALKDRHGLAQTFDLLGMSSLLHGQCVQGAEYCREAISFWREANARKELASSLTTLSFLGLRYDGREVMVPAAMTTVECLRYGEEAMDHARAAGWRAGEAYTLFANASCHATQGQYGLALERVQRGLEIAQEIAHRQWMCFAYRISGHICLDLLALSRARHQLDKSLALARQVGSIYHTYSVIARLCLTAIEEHEYALAEDILNAEFSSELPMQTAVQRLLWRERASLALAQRNPELSLWITDRLFASAANVEAGDIGALPYIARIRGEALTALERLEEAEATLLAALNTTRAEGIPRLLWRIHVALGKVYQARKQHARASQSFASARIVVDAMAATVYDPEVRNNFVQRAYATISPTASTPLQAAKHAHAGLTRREREVAALIAKGKANREIADELVISVRTVEGHASNILRKLDFDSRTEIAVWAVETGLSHR